MSTTTSILKIKGTRYYTADELERAGKLQVGALLDLVREPNNPYDRNAVAVHLRSPKGMLGHISRQSAPKYTALVRDNKVNACRIQKVGRDGGYLNIDIKVVYESQESEVLAMPRYVAQNLNRQQDAKRGKISVASSQTSNKSSSNKVDSEPSLNRSSRSSNDEFPIGWVILGIIILFFIFSD